MTYSIMQRRIAVAFTQRVVTYVQIAVGECICSRETETETPLLC